MKKKKTFQWGKTSQKIMLYTLPLMIFQAFALTLYIARLDSVAFVHQRESIFFLLEALSRMSLCLTLGTILVDYAEKKTVKNR